MDLNLCDYWECHWWRKALKGMTFAMVLLLSCILKTLNQFRWQKSVIIYSYPIWFDSRYLLKKRRANFTLFIRQMHYLIIAFVVQFIAIVQYCAIVQTHTRTYTQRPLDINRSAKDLFMLFADGNSAFSCMPSTAVQTNCIFQNKTIASGRTENLMCAIRKKQIHQSIIPDCIGYSN